MRARNRNLRTRRRAAGVAVMLTALSACASGPSSQAGADPVVVSGAAAVALEEAGAAVDAAQQRGQKLPDETIRPGVENKKIAIIPFSLDESGSAPAEAAQEAAAALGWEATVYDGRSDVAGMTGLVRQAVTAGADAIIAINIDCALAAEGFAEAKAKGVLIVPLSGFDCDDPESPGAGPSVFSGYIKTGELTPGEFFMQAGADEAQAVIAASGNTAKVVSVENDELAVLRYIQKGFNDTIAASQGSEVVEKVEFTTQDYVSGRATTQVQSALLKNPDATHLKSPFAGASQHVVVPAVRAARSEVITVGGEGLQSEIDLIREGSMLAAATVPGDRAGWAAVDTLNSLFQGAPIADSGIEWVLVDDSNVDSADELGDQVDFKTAYRNAWQVG